jgi:regulator of cell morphogenesis and NO signaling
MPQATVGSIVADDFRTAAIFGRHGIDFCCRGGRSLAEACAEHGIETAALVDELAAISDLPGAPRFASWSPRLLIDYVIGNHHEYVRRITPTLLAHVRKVARVHGDRHPELREVEGLFETVATELLEHMEKEEQVLFPAIVAIAERGVSADFPSGRISFPIAAMEAEHAAAGENMRRIAALTSGYSAPDDACTTYRVMLRELEEFERDLHAHVHLESNILFPRALGRG